MSFRHVFPNEMAPARLQLALCHRSQSLSVIQHGPSYEEDRDEEHEGHEKDHHDEEHESNEEEGSEQDC